ncbi:MAG: sigma 54-interacting transcriptional regulator, partial [Rhodocyclaceae bacterium]|nr:sigma 54-interacting transcriptional regulator [Rhodocyclaceae bacterium]
MQSGIVVENNADSEIWLGSLMGASAQMREVFRLIRTAAPTDITVLIEGESGSGKELAAQVIHALSARARGPLRAVNCGAIAENLIASELFGHERGSFTGATRDHRGYFERASGGTLFLDEITEMP